VCPAELPEPITARAQALAVATYDLLGCDGVARVDMMLEEATSELFVLEANVIPGMTDTSLLPQAAEAAGIAFEGLVERLLELAFERDAGRATV
jgi:D-alanine-D-alanine ligase